MHSAHANPNENISCSIIYSSLCVCAFLDLHLRFHLMISRYLKNIKYGNEHAVGAQKSKLHQGRDSRVHVISNIRGSCKCKIAEELPRTGGCANKEDLRPLKDFCTNCRLAWTVFVILADSSFNGRQFEATRSRRADETCSESQKAFFANQDNVRDKLTDRIKESWYMEMVVCLLSAIMIRFESFISQNYSKFLSNEYSVHFKIMLIDLFLLQTLLKKIIQFFV